ncbi:T5orf172 domain-containing protein [Anaerovirgula multivorans]|uniref:T5orf172 domain-containing protein n=1 Tax=Anaerovirgula multivorans TaxID=312168 RepID=A0A239I271_9FIRM|nr:GIY-YIG nuclease family protein [Anaerovirgula multivorans]SNS87358.1 T5orf172 domain-containing protein [Anaerovirgula multivorans]
MNKKFDSIFNEDHLGLLTLPDATEKSERTPEEQRLINSFEEINNFYEENGRVPELGSEIDEFMLASRLQGIRNNPQKVKTLLPFDFHNLLKCESSKSVTVEDILGDDPLNLLNVPDMDDSVFSLKYVKKSDRIRPEYISRRNKCKDFDEYETMFNSVHEDLKYGRRKLTEFKEQDLEVGKFFVLRGILLYLEKSSHTLQKEEYSSGTRFRQDGRTRCIFDNGTESDMLFRSLYKALLSDGFGVSEVEEHASQDVQIDENDVQNGYIYVLSSLSNNPQIEGIENLYKVGYCKGDVTGRIKNAVNEPTYLMSEVKIVLTVRCYNLNVPYLESNIHNFFKEVNVAFEVIDKNGDKHYPREWFIAPLSVIEEAIKLVVEQKIEKYTYNSKLGTIIKI